MAERKSSGTYVIDADYNIVNFNQTAGEIYPMLRLHEKCYKVLMNGTEPCESCPVARGIRGPRTYMDPIRHIYETVDAVELPMEDGSVGHALVFSTVPEESAEQDAERRKLLLVGEQDGGHEELLGLLGQDYEILEARGVEQGLSLLNAHYLQLSAVLVELDLALADNCHFLVTAGRDALLRTVPIVILAGESIESQAEEQCLREGAVEFVLHPFDPPVVRSRIRNITRLREAAASLRIIERDDLTGLYTRPAFYHHARAYMNADPSADYIICISDVENFRMLNVDLGRERGDEVLCYLADYFYHATPDGVCGRLAGDQFVVLARSRADRQLDWVEQMIADITAHAPVPGLVIKCGLYEHIDTSLPVSEICDRAMLAVRSVKHNYKKSFATYDAQISQKHYRDKSFEARFPAAIRQEEFVVWYQPQYDPRTGGIVGAEGLVRWRGADGTILSPGAFLPVFESDGLIADLDEYVFARVCALQSRRQAQGSRLLPISVNLSRNSMYKENLVERYTQIVRQAGISPDLVPIEITETAAMSSEEIRPLVSALHEAGFTLHMDDFGSGRSSMSSLNILPLDVVKLDKSLVDYIGDPQGEKILRSTIALASDLGLRIVAEGVEHKEQADFLRESGCDEIQGFYYSEPLPQEEFERRVDEEK